jgi:hypothetical protein
MNASLLRIFCTTAAFLLADAAQADYLWLQREGQGARVHAGELHQPLSALPTFQALLADGKALPADAQQSDHVAIPASGPDDLRFTATHAGADGVLTYYQAKLGRTETKAVNDLELVPTESNGNTFQLVFKGRPVAASQVNVDTSEGWRRVLTPAKDGTVSFVPSFPGLYVLEVTARVNNGSVTLDGRKYGDVRHTATLSFEIKN